MANVVGGSVIWNLDIDDSQFRQKLATAGKTAQDFGDKTGKAVGKVGSFIATNLNGAGLAAGTLGAALKIAGGAALKSAGNFEQTRIAMEGILGSADQARAMLSKLSDFAASTPFEFKDVAELSNRLLAVGFSAEEIIPSLTTLGDVAATLGSSTDDINSAIRAIGQMRGSGTIRAEELNQLNDALSGFNAKSVLTEGLARETGKSFEEMAKLVNNGAVPAEQGIRILLDGMKQFPGAAGAMARQAKTLNGLMSTLNDVAGNAIRTAIGIEKNGDVREGSIFDIVRKAVADAIPYIERFTPKVVEFLNQVASNKQAVAGLAGLLGGALVAALVAAAYFAGAAIVVLGIFMTVGAALGALALKVYQNWNPIRDFFINLWNTVTGAFRNAVTTIVNQVNWLKDNWAFALGYMLGYFLTIPSKMGAAALDMVVRIWNSLRSIDWVAVGNAISSAFQSAFDAIKRIAQKTRDAIAAINWGEVFVGIARGIGNTVIGLIEGGIKGAASGIPGLEGLAGRLRIPRFAGGVENFAGGLAVVGERGPELVNLPRGADVIPNNQLETRRSGVNITNNITMSRITDIDALNRRMSFQAATL